MTEVTTDQINRFLQETFISDGRPPLVEEIADGYARLSLHTDATHIRPGDLISGPTQMSLADTAMYVAVFTRCGIIPMAVTSSLNTSFLRPCPAADPNTAKDRLLTCGRRLAVGFVEIFAVASDKLASQTVVTHVISSESDRV